MILAVLGVDGGNPQKTLLIGLSRENVDRMLADQPVHIKRETHGEAVPLGWEIAIVYGETEDAIVQMLTQSGLTIPKMDDRR